MDEGRPPEPRRDTVGNHLANERTFLAWLRTGISFISLGIAVNRFSLYLAQQAGAADPPGMRTLLLRPEDLGLGLVLFGMSAIFAAAWRYGAVRRKLERGDFRPAGASVWGAAAAVLLLTGTSLLWLFQH